VHRARIMTRKTAAAALKRPQSATEPSPQKDASGPKIASSEASPVASGAHELQDLLARRLDSPAPAKWPPHAGVGFVLVVCGAFWAGLFIVVRLLIH